MFSTKEEIRTAEAPAAIGPYAQAVRTGGLVFTSGQIPVDPCTGAVAPDVEGQAVQALENVKNLLAAAGCGMDDVVKTTVFLTDMNDFAALNAVYARYFREPFPARSCVAVTALPKGVRLEVEAVAAP